MDALFQRNKKALSKATTLDSDTSVFEGELPRKYLFFYQLNIHRTFCRYNYLNNK